MLEARMDFRLNKGSQFLPLSVGTIHPEGVQGQPLS
jgi:hypothetical protein